MQRTCGITGATFEVLDDDLKFYEKVSPVIGKKKYLIPEPTLSPDARMQRRLTFRNQATLYQRTCDSSGKKIISIYSPDKPHKVYSPEEWWSDKWNATDFGREFDFNRSFFDQFGELMIDVPHISVLLVNSENSEYTNQSYNNRNCYLSSAIKDCDGLMYCHNGNKLVDCSDISFCFNSELLYECHDTYESYGCLHSSNCINCTECIFCYDCIGCMNCFGCAGLRKQQHQIFNKQYSKEEYQEKIRAMNLHTHSGIETARKQFNEFVLTIPHLYSWVKNCQNCTGNNLKNSKNALFCFDSMDLEDCRYSSWIFGCKDSYDCYGMGESQVVYDCVGVEEVQQVAFSFGTSNSSECYYTDLCFNCNHLFGCVGLRNKEYCVFNKQYSKDEYNELVPRIIEHMQKTGEWGEFFSPKISVFAYNESKAQEHYPLTKEEALKQGYKWKDDVDQIPKVEKVIPAGKLPDEIKDIPDDVLNWAIQCEVSGRPFIITKKELKIYRDKNFPMPHLHPEERQKRRMAVRPPQKLWKRECSKTGKEVWSPYSTEDSTIILCEEAYQEMMY